MLKLYDEYVIVISDDKSENEMVSILCENVFLTIMKTHLTLCQQVVRVLGDGYKGLMEESVLWGYS